MLKATIAEILHAKDAVGFGRLIGHFLESGLLSERSVRRQRRKGAARKPWESWSQMRTLRIRRKKELSCEPA